MKIPSDTQSNRIQTHSLQACDKWRDFSLRVCGGHKSSRSYLLVMACCFHVFLLVGINECFAKNNGLLSDDKIIALFVESREFKKDAAKMSEDTRFSFLPGSVTLLKQKDRYCAKVRVHIDEGDHFVLFKEYFIRDINKIK
jgi:hypothetical protein